MGRDYDASTLCSLAVFDTLHLRIRPLQIQKLEAYRITCYSYRLCIGVPVARVGEAVRASAGSSILQCLYFSGIVGMDLPVETAA